MSSGAQPLRTSAAQNASGLHRANSASARRGSNPRPSAWKAQSDRSGSLPGNGVCSDSADLESVWVGPDPAGFGHRRSGSAQSRDPPDLPDRNANGSPSFAADLGIGAE